MILFYYDLFAIALCDCFLTFVDDVLTKKHKRVATAICSLTNQ